jgi:flagellar protein FlgJ
LLSSIRLDKLSSVADASVAAAPKDDPAKIRESAKQFEALLIGQMLKSMRDSEGGWLGTGEDESSSSAMEYAQESFAQALASRGGLGLAAIVTKGFEKAE